MNYENFPFIIGWELTLKCNLNCAHCASSAGRPRNNELSLSESLSVSRQFRELLVNEVVFTGGEPLLNENWNAIAESLAESGIKTGMVTNGLLITDDTIKKMKDTGLTSIGISLDGIGGIHDNLRGLSGAFEKTIGIIDKLRKNDINVTAISSVTSESIKQLDELFGLVKNLSCWKWQLQPLFPLGRGKANSGLHLSDDDFIALGRYIFDLRPEAQKNNVEIVPADSCGYFSDLDIPEFGWQGCSAGRVSCGIMSDGRIKGCLSWPDEYVEGDLRKDDLWTIWFRDNAFASRRHFTESDMKGACAGCDSALECGGGCQAMSLAATGKWRADPYCYKRILERESAEQAGVTKR